MDTRILRTAILTSLTILIVVIAADARRYRAKDARSKHIDSMIAFRPLVQVGIIREGNAIVYSDSFTNVSRGMHEALLGKFGPKMKLREHYVAENEASQGAIDAEVAALFAGADRKTYLEDGLSCPRIEAVAKAKGMRFVLLVQNAGFLRTKANFRAEERKGIAPAIISLGMVNKITIAVNSNMRAMILDLRERRTYFYNDWYGTETTNQQSPVNPETLEKQFRALFTTFFWSAPM